MREEIRCPYKDKKILKKEISPRTKASPTKASLFDKLSKIENLHQSDISFVSLIQQKATICIFIYFCYSIVFQ